MSSTDKITWSTQTRKIKDLTPFPSNPRKMSKEQARSLLDSLEKFDYVELVAVNTDNTILAGHMRIKAMQQLGWGKNAIEVRVPSRQLTEEEAKEYVIRSNKNTGDWDFDILASSFNADDLHSWGFESDQLVDIFQIDVEEEKKEKDAPLTKCPKCGHEF